MGGVRRTALLFVLSGCTFDPSGEAPPWMAADGAVVDAPVGPDGPAWPGPDAPPGARPDAALPDAALPDAMSPCPPDPTLRACFRFENDVVDESLYGTVVLDETGVEYTTGMDGQALRTNRVDSSVVLEESSNLDMADAITIELWARPFELPGSRVYFFDNNNQYSLSAEADADVDCNIAGKHAFSDNPVQVDTWYHIACTYDRTQIKLYVDGVLQSSPNNETGAVPVGGTDGSCIARGSPVGSGGRFAGLLDELRVWSRALGEAEICASYGRCP